MLGQFVNPLNQTSFDDIHWGFSLEARCTRFGWTSC